MPGTTPTSETSLLHSTAFDDLGVTLHAGGGTLRVWSGNAIGLELVVFDDTDLDWITAELPMSPSGHGVWEVTSELLHPGARYAVRAVGPQQNGSMFNSRTLLLDPYAKGITAGGFNDWRSVVVDGTFDWGGAAKPRVPLDRTVLY
ncbi:MAG TPA: glycogen debranching enzyme, partial [Microbacterium ginsengisoli]|nr:glycogen debranching enzyme [Microbacterium ginsengisoli]